MSKKRKRDASDIDLDLVKIYDQLADDDADIRIAAAQKLLSKVYNADTISASQIEAIITRLFRGLCSSRKAARVGFSVGLTEFLSVPYVTGTLRNNESVSAAKIVDILQTQTAFDGKSTGQEERDHYIGRLFGAESVLKSGLLFPDTNLGEWIRLIDIICDIALKKPWLRRECGWILYVATTARSGKPLPPGHALAIVERLVVHKLIRTPEGLAIWLGARHTFPDLQLPKNVWKRDHPLAKKDVDALAEILKDANAQSGIDGETYEAQGAARWSQQLHYVWTLVLQHIIAADNSGTSLVREKAARNGQVALVDFEQFWTDVIEKHFFNISASKERKHVAFSVWSTILSEAPPPLLKFTFTKNAVHCLGLELKGQDRYLQKSAYRVTRLLTERLAGLEGLNTSKIASQCLQSILGALDLGDFDQISKTKTIQKLIECDNIQVRRGLLEALQHTFSVLVTSTPENIKALKSHVEMMSRLISVTLQTFNAKGQLSELDAQCRDDTLSSALRLWIRHAYFNHDGSPAVSQELRRYLSQKLASSFEHCLSLGRISHGIIVQAVKEIRKLEKTEVSAKMIAQFDDRITRIIDGGWFALESMQAYVKRGTSEGRYTYSAATKDLTAKEKAEYEHYAFFDGMTLLYSVVLFEVCNGETEAVEILEELSHRKDINVPTNSRQSDGLDSSGRDVDSLIEILLSFASRPSRFMRKVTSQVFEVFAPQVTADGLASLTRILKTRENAQGQEMMFEQELEMNVENDSDVEMLGSDVEEVSSSESDSEQSGEEGASESEGSDSSTSSSGPDNPEEEELAAFDAALANALGTRKGQDDLQADDTSGSSSDEDMDDEEMTALDEKLTEVFRARSQQTNKKKEQRDAKVNVVNFKNRVLDMIEVYLKSQYLNSLSIELVIPLLQLARQTQSKQLADKACSIIREYTARCKGQNVPQFKTDTNDILHIADLLQEVHHEACLESSNAHSMACSQASLQLTKIWVYNGGEFGKVVSIYGQTRVRQVTDPACKVQPAFFSDWNNWCISARTSLAK